MSPTKCLHNTSCLILEPCVVDENHYLRSLTGEKQYYINVMSQAACAQKCKDIAKCSAWKYYDNSYTIPSVRLRCYIGTFRSSGGRKRGASSGYIPCSGKHNNQYKWVW